MMFRRRLRTFKRGLLELPKEIKERWDYQQWTLRSGLDRVNFFDPDAWKMDHVGYWWWRIVGRWVEFLMTIICTLFGHQYTDTEDGVYCPHCGYSRSFPSDY